MCQMCLIRLEVDMFFREISLSWRFGESEQPKLSLLHKKSVQCHWYEVIHNTLKCVNCTQILKMSNIGKLQFSLNMI